MKAPENPPVEPAVDAAGEPRFKRKQVISEGFKNKTKGEAVFNAVSYGGVGYFGVTGVSVAMTGLLRDTKKIAPVFEKFVTTSVKKTGLNSSIVNILTLFTGGTIASVLPVKWLEDKKPQIVRQLDNLLYSDQELADPKIIHAHRELDAMPKQTWLSVFSSRVVAFAATFGVYFLMGSNKSPIAKLTGHSLDEASIKFGRWMDRSLSRGKPEVAAEIDHAIATNIERMNKAKYGKEALGGLEVTRGPGGDRVASRIWSYIGLDAIYTLVTSNSLFIFTRIFGGLMGKPAPQHPASDRRMPATPSLDTAQPAESLQAAAPQNAAAPGTQVQAFSHLERVAKPSHSAELTS